MDDTFDTKEPRTYSSTPNEMPLVTDEDQGSVQRHASRSGLDSRYHDAVPMGAWGQLSRREKALAYALRLSAGRRAQ